MKVSYQPAGKHRGRQDTDGIAVQTGWQFFYAGQAYQIPAVYLFRKGFVLDIIGTVDTEALRKFHDRYAPREEYLTPRERAQAMLEHPYQPLSGMKLWFNGEEVTSWHTDEALFVPWQEHMPPLAEEAFAAYAFLSKENSFSMTRLHARYPKAQGGVFAAMKAIFTRPKLKELRLLIHPTEQMLPLEHAFAIGTQEKEHPALSFTHPVTGVAHTLQATDAKWMDLTAQFQKLYRMRKRSGGRVYPITQAGQSHVLEIAYRVSPPLPEGERLQLQDEERTLQPRDTAESGTAAKSACAIGIIGSADGPTAIYMAGREKKAPETYGVCCSRVYPRPQASCTVRLEGVWVQKEPEQAFLFHVT